MSSMSINFNSHSDTKSRFQKDRKSMFINQLGLNMLSPLKNKILDIDPLFPNDDEIA